MEVISVEDKNDTVNVSENIKELSDRKKRKLNRYAEKYKSHEKLMIASSTRKTIRYIEKTIVNIPNKYMVLKNNIIASCYSILEHIYRANISRNIFNSNYIYDMHKLCIYFKKRKRIK